jgi:hypothetical protein
MLPSNLKLILISILASVVQKSQACWAPVVHAYNPSCSGGRNQEDQDSKPTWANSSRNYLENTLHRKELMEWLKVKVLSSSPSTTKKKKRKEKERNYRHVQPRPARMSTMYRNIGKG